MMSATPPRAAYIAHSQHEIEATALTRGPWDPNHQHAGPPIAMVCRAIEAVAAGQGLTHIGRLTCNLLRPLPIGRITVEVEADYAGRNAAHYSARIRGGGKELARFTALVQREATTNLPDRLAGHPLPLAPETPDASPAARMPFGHGTTGYADLVENRAARGRMFQGPSAVWFRLRAPLVEGETPSGYQRVAVAADSGNGISAILDIRHYSFVNADLTLNLLRRPTGEWACVDARTWLAPNGCGLVTSQIFDEAGLVGHATQSLAVRDRNAPLDR